MPFGPVNAPAFYTCMMGNFKGEWDTLFIEIMHKLASSNSKLGENIVTCREKVIFIGDLKLNSGTKSVIDDILLWSNNIQAILIYLECICRVFQKYRVSFRLDKCEFLKERVEFVGHDLTADGNSPAASKFNMIND